MAIQNFLRYILRYQIPIIDRLKRNYERKNNYYNCFLMIIMAIIQNLLIFPIL